MLLNLKVGIRVKIESIDVTVFTYPTRRVSDSAGHSHPGEENQAKMALLTLTTDDRHQGYAFAPPEVVRPHIINAFFRKVLIGQNPFDRERLWQDLVHWQRGSANQLTDRAISIVESALWDLQGRFLNMPARSRLPVQKTYSYAGPRIEDLIQHIGE